MLYDNTVYSIVYQICVSMSFSHVKYPLSEQKMPFIYLRLLIDYMVRIYFILCLYFFYNPLH